MKNKKVKITGYADQHGTKVTLKKPVYQHRDRVYKTKDYASMIANALGVTFSDFGKGQQVKIEVEVCESDILLRIGKRDWQWDRVTGKLVGAGTLLALTFFILALGPAARAQGTSPMHSSPLSHDQMMQKMADKPQPPAAQSDDPTPTYTPTVSTPVKPAPVYEKSPDATTADDIDALAAKLRKQREAKEKARKAAEQKAKESDAK